MITTAAAVFTAPLSKNEEKQLFAATVASLPDGYVRDILGGLADQVESAIDCDYGFVDLRGIMDDCRTAQAELAETKKQLSDRLAQLEGLRAEVRTARASLLAAGREFQALADNARELQTHCQERAAIAQRLLAKSAGLATN